MKTLTSFALSASLTCALFTSCTKDNMKPNSGDFTSAATETSAASTAKGDRINAIMKDLSVNSYSLSFDKAMPEVGITKTAYGADNYLAFADPQDLICGDLIRWKYVRVPIWKRPNIVQPTCPDMSIDIYKLSQVQDLLMKGDYAQYGNLKQMKLLNGGAFMATETFTKEFSAMKADKIDEALNGLKLDGFLMLNAPGNFGTGATRNFYGQADLNKIVFQPYKKNLIDILKPTLKGCYDPIILSSIKERLQKIDPSFYKGLSVSYLPETKSIGILSMN